MLEPDRELRIEKARAANAALIALADEFDRSGLATEVVAAGGLGTWDITGANPRITEIHAGSYIFMDAFHRNLVPGFEVALTVLGTIISRSGEGAVLDVGRKAIGIDRTLPEVVGGARSSATSTASTSSTRSTPRSSSTRGPRWTSVTASS